MTQSSIDTDSHHAAAADPDPRQELDPGMRYTLTARSGTVNTTLGTIVVISNSGRVTEYFTMSNALPAGATSITISAAIQTTAPTSYTFSTPASGFTTTTPPSSSSTLFVNNTSNVGLVWGFTKSGSTWIGSATWYHDSSSTISIGNGQSITLSNNTYDANLTYRAINSA